MSKTATIYRMVTPDHLCPWGLKAIDLLQHEDLQIDDRHLASQEANNAYKEKNHVDETPQIYIEGKHIGGYDDLREHLGKRPEGQEGTTYQPIVAIFATTFFTALSASFSIYGNFLPSRIFELFIAFSMIVLGIMKLRDLSSFSVQFLSYDLLARKKVRYAYAYPFLETGAGILMLGGFLTFLSSAAAFFIGTVGAISVVKAVYIDKRQLKCACVGGGSNVPLGFVSLTENLMMVTIAVWMILRA